MATVKPVRKKPVVQRGEPWPDLPDVEVGEVPELASEAEEDEFWSTHAFGESFFRQDIVDPDLPRPRTRPIALRFDASTVARAKALAARRNKGYQTLLKEFVMERLYEEEKREGILPPR